jgi:hypothetical protein
MGAPLFIIANLNDKGEVVGYPLGGGSSATGYVRAFTEFSSAQRSLQGLQRISRAGSNAQVMQVTAVEEAF